MNFAYFRSSRRAMRERAMKRLASSKDEGSRMKDEVKPARSALLQEMDALLKLPNLFPETRALIEAAIAEQEKAGHGSTESRPAELHPSSAILNPPTKEAP